MNDVDQVIRSFGNVAAGDDGERDAIDGARRALRAAIAAEQGKRRPFRRRGRMIALFAVLAIAGIAVPALGVGDWVGGGEFAGVKGSKDPKLTSDPIVVAASESPAPWQLVLARSDHGLCLNTDVGDGQFSAETYRLGDCGYSHIHGDLPLDVRGDPRATCIGPTELVRCGSLPHWWVDASQSGTHIPRTDRSIVAGAAAADVASVELVLSNGQSVEAQVAQRPLGLDVPLNVYWALLGPEHGLTFVRNVEGQLLPCDEGVVEEVVARDADGNVLGSRVPVWNGNPTGDPDGARPPRPTEPCV